jgi:hypothetical protein
LVCLRGEFTAEVADRDDESGDELEPGDDSDWTPSQKDESFVKRKQKTAGQGHGVKHNTIMRRRYECLPETYSKNQFLTPVFMHI